MSVPSNRVRYHGSTPPRKQCTPGDQWGSGGVTAPPGQFRAGFSEQQALELIRKASTMPACQFTPLDKLTVFFFSYNANSDMALISPIPTLLTLSFLDHQARGDLDGAWAD